MKDFTKEREIYQNKKKELETKRKKLTSKIDKEINKLNNKCGHSMLFLIHYEETNNTKYFIRAYCYSCGRTISIRKLENDNYTNLIDVYPIISKFIPNYVEDKYKICIVNEAVDKIVKTFNPKSYEELTRICKKISNKLLNNIDNIKTFEQLQKQYKSLTKSKRSL